VPHDRIRKAGERALVGQVPGVQRHEPDITAASSRSSPSIAPKRSAWLRRRAANTTDSRDRFDGLLHRRRPEDGGGFGEKVVVDVNQMLAHSPSISRRRHRVYIDLVTALWRGDHQFHIYMLHEKPWAILTKLRAAFKAGPAPNCLGG